MSKRSEAQNNARTVRLGVLTGLSVAAMASSALVVYVNGALAWPIWLTIGIGLVLAALIWADLTWLRLPDALTFPLIGVGLVHASLVRGSLPMALIGAGLAYGAIFGLNWLWKRRRGEDGIGMGDAKFLAGAGAWFGPLALSPLMLMASGAGLALVGVRRLLMRGHNFERHLPFGPFLILGFWIIWLFPDAFMAR